MKISWLVPNGSPRTLVRILALKELLGVPNVPEKVDSNGAKNAWMRASTLGKRVLCWRSTDANGVAV